jgi:hypothetical protein
MSVKIQPFGTYRIVSIASDGKKHEWNLTIIPNKNAWKLASREVCIGDILNGFLIKEVYEMSEPSVQRENIDKTDSQARNQDMKESPNVERQSGIAKKKFVNSKRWLKSLEQIEQIERRMRKSTSYNIDPWFNNISGIYQIKNSVNGNYYIGRSKNVGSRWRYHIDELRESVHHNYLLQEDWWWNLGEYYFTFELLERCNMDMEELVEREQEYLDDHFCKSNCYNLFPYAYDELWYIEMIKMKRKK